MEDNISIVLSLGLIFATLIYIYPLKMVFSSLFAWLSNGWLPTVFQLNSINEIPELFVIYGLGYTLISFLLTLHYVRAFAFREQLLLNPLERIHTKGQIITYTIYSTTALFSVLWAMFLPAKWGIWAGFWYMTYVITIPMSSKINHRSILKTQKAGNTSVEPTE